MDARRKRDKRLQLAREEGAGDDPDQDSDISDLSGIQERASQQGGKSPVNKKRDGSPDVSDAVLSVHHEDVDDIGHVSSDDDEEDGPKPI